MRIDSDNIPNFHPLSTNPRFLNRTGHVYGHYTVLGFLGKNRWLCRCSCGQLCDISSGNFTQPTAQSCGCQHKQFMKEKQTVHGNYFHPLYQVWSSMIARCERPSATGFKDYGHRGIKVCDRWHDFLLFVSDMGERPKGYTLNRVNNDGDYCPENCTWASHTEQMNNTRRIKKVTLDGVTLPFYTWAAQLGIPKRTARGRLDRGLTPIEALTQPYTPRKRFRDVSL